MYGLPNLWTMNSYWFWLPLELQEYIVKITRLNLKSLVPCHEKIKKCYYDPKQYDTWPVPNKRNKYRVDEFNEVVIKQIKDQYGCIRYLRPIYRVFYDPYYCYKILNKNGDWIEYNHPMSHTDDCFFVDITQNISTIEQYKYIKYI